MELNNIRKLVEQIEFSVFSFNNKNLSSEVGQLAEQLVDLSSKLPDSMRNNFNNLLDLINTSYGNKDYLLLADITKYELVPFVLNLGITQEVN